ncbi:MAG: hypothetical protein P4M12_00115 [Gammaproteobacteria bacterium]|nr:hypothetical protein [Gammaproteobacteria bacterium]
MNNRSTPYIMPISNQIELELFENEVRLNEAKISLDAHNENGNNLLRLTNSQLQQHIADYNKQQQSLSLKTEKYIVSPIARNLWNLLLNVGIFLKETIASTTAIISKLLFPIHFAIDGARTLWDLYQITRTKMIAKKMQFGATALSLSAITAGAVVLGLGIVNPFALPAIFAVMTGAAIFKSIYLSRKIPTMITDEKENLKKVDDEISALAMQDNNPTNDAQFVVLNAQKTRHAYQITHLQTQLFHARRETAFNGISAVAIGLLVGGIFFPPLVAAGLFLFASAGMVNLIDSKINFWISKKISGVANGIAHIWKKLTNSLSNRKAPQPLIDDVDNKIYHIINNEQAATPKPSMQKTQNDSSFGQKGSYSPSLFQARRSIAPIKEETRLQKTFSRSM